MRIFTNTAVCAAVFAATVVAYADSKSSPVATVEAASPAANVFGSANSKPPPAEEVFLPDVFTEDDGSITLGFRMPPGYYIYKDKISLRSLNKDVEIGELKLPPGETVIDDWFGEQQVYYLDMMANAPVTIGNDNVSTLDVEVSWQGCKGDELCYLPVSKIISVELAAQVESAAD